MKRLAYFVFTLLFILPTLIQAQLVNVTFKANLATVPDTLGPNSVVQIRGTTMTAAGQARDDQNTDTLSTGVLLAWNGQSTMFMKNVGGDFWEGTFAIPTGIRISYKFFTNSSSDTVYSGADWEHRGWENSLELMENVYSGNRGLDLTTFTGTDTTLPLQFVNGLLSGPPQFFRPYVETDSIDVWFRVNIQTYEDFNPETQVVGVRGAVSPGSLGDLSSDRTLLLTQERRHSNSGQCNYDGRHFWSGQVRIPAESVSPGQTIEYKFVIMNIVDPPEAEPLVWEEIPNRAFTIPTTKADTTLHWVWFNNKAPKRVAHNDRVRITFIVDMTRAIQNRGFSPGDTVVCRVGYFNTAREVTTIELRRQGITPFYKGTDNIYTTIGGMIDYQYYSYKMGRDYREVYFNYYYTGEATGEAERRQVLVMETPLTVADTLSSEIESRRMPFFRNVSVLAQDVLVTLTCDVRPAIYQLKRGSILEDIQGNVNVTHPDSVMSWGVAVNGPITGSWSNSFGPDWGVHLMRLENKRMYDDGTHGDVVADDSVFSIQFQFYKDSADVVGQEFKFGIGGGDNEGGYGNNHIENIDDSQSAFTLAAQFGSIDPVFYSAWDYDKKQPSTAVDGFPGKPPLKFALEQNYPNPFNPETHIKYTLARSEKVKLTIYNLLGHQVISLVNTQKPAGNHTVAWDGRDADGRLVGSGVYFYRIEAGDFVKTHKMLMLK